MNPARFVPVLLAICVWFVSFIAHADDGAVSARFASTVGTEGLRSAACGMKPTVTIDGRARPVDVIALGRRCESSIADAASLPLSVRVEAGATRHVVLDMTAPAGVRVEALRESLLQIEGVLAARVAIVMALRPVAVRDAGFPTPSVQGPLPVEAWHRVHDGDPGRVAAIVIPSVLAGVALLVGVCLAVSSIHYSVPIHAHF